MPQDTSPTGFTRSTGERIVGAVRMIEGRGKSLDPPARRRRGVLGSGGGSTNNLTKFAQVTQTASANMASAGKCVLLNEFLEAQDESGDPLILDPENEDYDVELVEAVEVTFYSAHTDSACGVGARIKVSATIAIEPGASDDEDHPILGEHVDGSSYWEGHSSFGNSKYLGATGGEALYREFTTATPEVGGTGSGECDGEGGVDIEVDISVTGGPFVVPPTEPE